MKTELEKVAKVEIDDTARKHTMHYITPHQKLFPLRPFHDFVTAISMSVCIECINFTALILRIFSNDSWLAVMPSYA